MVAHLLRSHKRGPKHRNALRDHLHFKLVGVLEPVKHVLQCWVAIELKAVPKSPLSLAVLMVSSAFV